MLTLEHDSGTGQLARAFAQADARLRSLEQRIDRGETLPLADTVDDSIALVRDLITAYVAEKGIKGIPEPTADLLEVFKLLVKGEPSWHAIRDNCRELVYYRNCINMERPDALPQVPEKMAVRTARHVYLYIRTRCIREGRLQA
jgi:hypothetical protein